MRTITGCIAVAILTGCGCLAAIAIFEDAFRRGATLSGINMEGGPGFVLILLPAVAGALLQRRLTGRKSFPVGLAYAACTAGGVLALVALGSTVALPRNYPDISALYTTSGIALLVGWAVERALDEPLFGTPSAGNGSSASGQMMDE